MIPPLKTTITGIFQSDLLIQYALDEAFKNIKKNAWLLDYAFAWLPKDDLTSERFGQKQSDLAKAWFLATEVPVFLGIKRDIAKKPCVSITLTSSAEVENTLGDVHYEPQEDADVDWPVLAGPFDPLSYNPATGVMTAPAATFAQTELSTGQVIVDTGGRAHPVLETLDDSTFRLDPYLMVDFRGATLRGSKPSYAVQLEGANFRESYAVTVVGDGEPDHAVWLHSIVVFALLAYRKTYLEGRGFERSSISSADLTTAQEFEASEVVYVRKITVSGVVRNTWPRNLARKISAVAVQPRVIGGGRAFPDDAQDQLWVGDGDEDFLAGVATPRPTPPALPPFQPSVQGYLDRLLGRAPLHLWLLNNSGVPVSGSEPDLGSGGVVLAWSGPPSTNPPIVPNLITTSQRLSGSSEYANTPNGAMDFDQTSSFKMQWWIEPRQFDFGPGYDGFSSVGWSSAFSVGTDSIGKVHVTSDGVTDLLVSVSSLSIAQAAMLTVSYDGTTLKLYVNGALESSAPVANVRRPGTSSWYVNVASAEAVFQIICYETAPGTDADVAADYAAAQVSA